MQLNRESSICKGKSGEALLVGKVRNACIGHNHVVPSHAAQIRTHYSLLCVQQAATSAARTRRSAWRA